MKLNYIKLLWSKVSATSIFFVVYRPKMIICGASSYPREWDCKRLRKIADDTGAYLFCDMAHYAGLVAAQILNSPSNMHTWLRPPLTNRSEDPRDDFLQKGV